MKAWKAESLLFFVTFIWGGTFLFTKMGLNDSTPSTFIILRFLIAISISVICFHRFIFKMDKKTFKHGLILGLLFGIGFVLQTYGLKYTTISKSAFITGITVVMTPFAYYLIERKKISFWAKLGVVIAAIGLWLFTNPKFDNINIGDVMTLLSTILWALYISYMDVFTRENKKFAVTSQLVVMQLTAALPIACITFLLFDLNSFRFEFTNNLIFALAFNGILASFLLTLIHTGVQKYTNPVKAALIFSLEPVVASVFAYLIIQEILNKTEFIGAAILFSGVIITELGTNLSKKQSN